MSVCLFVCTKGPNPSKPTWFYFTIYSLQILGRFIHIFEEDITILPLQKKMNFYFLISTKIEIGEGGRLPPSTLSVLRGLWGKFISKGKKLPCEKINKINTFLIKENLPKF